MHASSTTSRGAVALLLLAGVVAVPLLLAAAWHEDGGRFVVVPITLQSRHDGASISAAVFYPATSACPAPVWTGSAWSGDTPEHCRVPVVAVASPYFGETCGAIVEFDCYTFLARSLLANGYAVAHVSVRGTGQSGGCSDYLGPKERADLDQTIRFLGESTWSTGKVAMTGVSYDGSTPWQVAATGNPFLTTIIPMAGVTNVANLHYRNGTSEVRAPALSTLYWSFGITRGGPVADKSSPDPVDVGLVERLCPDVALQLRAGATGAAYGNANATAADRAFWDDRALDRMALANYTGSVFLVQGLQDFNVKPTMAVPLLGQLQAHGIRTKALLGAWDHSEPRIEAWPERILSWLEAELKGLPVGTGPAVEVWDNYVDWRAEATYPPTDGSWIEFHPDASGRLVASGARGQTALAGPFGATCSKATPVPRCPVGLASFQSEPMPQATRWSGLPQVHVKVTPSGAGGLLEAQLSIEDEFETRMVGRAVMDLRYADGGAEPQPVVAGKAIVARMEFFPLDIFVPQGGRLVLRLSQLVPDARPIDTVAPPATGPLVLHVDGDASVLRLPTVTRIAAPPEPAASTTTPSSTDPEPTSEPSPS